MWLVGMMGSGKTTVGELAASEVGVPFYDTDRMVVDMSGMSIAEIWESSGESGFRDWEHRAVLEVPREGCIAAAGGGAVIDPESRRRIVDGAPVLWLRSDPGVLATRVGAASGRPLLHGESSQKRLLEILDERRQIYSEVATDVIDTDELTVEHVVAEVVSIWHR